MNIVIKKIVVLGGGSAGWMSACLLKKMFPEFHVCLIESAGIPTVGVGESTTGRIRNFLYMLGISDRDFIVNCDAIYKLAIKFTDFYELNDQGYFYPLGYPDLEGTKYGLKDWFHYKHEQPSEHRHNFIRSFFPSAALYEQGKFDINRNGAYDNYDPEINSSFHFDAVKFANFLSTYGKSIGVTHIIGTVKKVSAGEKGIENLILDDATSITGDLYIDCSGFSRSLISRFDEAKWKSYEHILPNNSAWVGPIPFSDKEKELVPYTSCTALSSGWAWNTPIWSRIGTGYTFCDRFISDEQALDEFKKFLKNDLHVKKENNLIEDLNFRKIKFKTGIYEQLFIKNTVAIGLSAGFLEPLEANGLFSIHEFLFKLCKVLQRGTVTQWDRDIFNAAAKKMHESFAHFIAMHYALTIRQDSPYWRFICDKMFVPNMPKLQPSLITEFQELQNRKMFQHDFDESAGMTYVATGMDYDILDAVSHTWIKNYYDIDFKKDLENSKRIIENKRNRWELQSRNSPSLYDFMTTNFYKK